MSIPHIPLRALNFASLFLGLRHTQAHFRNNSLIVIWISALASVWNGDYGERLMDIKDSFLLVEATKKK